MLKKILSGFVAVILALSVALCCTVVVKNALGLDKSIFGFRLFYIVSGSMEPTIPMGAAIVVHKSDAYHMDDIITFISSDTAIYGRPNTHRIVGQTEIDGQKAYITKGDANPIADELPVLEKDVYGKVVFNTGELYGLGTVLGMMTTPLGFVTVIILPILVIIAIMIRDFTKEYKEALAEEAREAMAAANAACQPMPGPEQAFYPPPMPAGSGTVPAGPGTEYAEQNTAFIPDNASEEPNAQVEGGETNE